MTWKGISADVLAAAGVAEEGRLIRVPYRLPDGRLFKTRVFTRTGRTWFEPAGLPNILFGLEKLTRTPSDEVSVRTLLVAEGESDALALRDQFPEADVVGVPGAASWRSDWSLVIERYLTVYVLGDGDEAGQKMNAAVVHDVPWARAVRLPDGEDVRRLLQAGGRPALERYIATADADARLWAAMRLAPDIETCERLLMGEEVPL